MTRLEVEAGQPRESAEDRNWRTLYAIGSGAAILLVAITLLHAAVFFVTGLPETVGEWFDLFERGALLGLLAFELLPLIFVVLSIPVVLALCVALRRSDPSLVALYVGVSFVGIVTFIAARPAFEMLSLSQSYTAATTDVDRFRYLAAGDAMLAVFHGTAFWVSYILGSIGGLILGTVMLRSPVFSRPTAYVRIASSVLDFGLVVPTVGIVISLVSVLCLLVFNVLIAGRLFQLSRGR